MAPFGDDYGQAGFRTAIMGMEAARKFDLENKTRDSLRMMDTGTTERPSEMDARAWQKADEDRTILKGNKIQNDTRALELREKQERDEFAKSLMVSMSNGDPGALLSIVNKHDKQFTHVADKDQKTGAFRLSLINRETGERQPFQPFQDGRDDISIREIGHAYSAGVFGPKGIQAAGDYIKNSGINPRDVSQTAVDFYTNAQEDVGGKWTAIDRRGTRVAIDKSQVPIDEYRKNRPNVTQDTGTEIQQGTRHPVTGAMVPGSQADKKQFVHSDLGDRVMYGIQGKGGVTGQTYEDKGERPGTTGVGANAANASRRIDATQAAAIEKSMQTYHEAQDSGGGKVLNQTAYQREVRHAINIANVLKASGTDISGPEAAALSRMHAKRLHEDALALTNQVKEKNPTFFADKKITEEQYTEMLVEDTFRSMAEPMERSDPRSDPKAMAGKTTADPKTEAQKPPTANKPAPPQEFRMKDRADKDSVTTIANSDIIKKAKAAGQEEEARRRETSLKQAEAVAREKGDPLQQMIDTRALMQQLQEIRKKQGAAEKPERPAMTPAPSSKMTPTQFQNRNM